MTATGTRGQRTDRTSADGAASASAQARLRRGLLMRWLVGVAIFFATAGIAVAVLRELTGREVAYGLIPLFDLDGEASLSAVFTAGLLLAAAFLTFAAGRAAAEEGAGFRRHWRVLGFGFLVMCVDELSGLHELFDRPVAALTGVNGGLLEFAWVIPAAVLAIAVLVAYTPFLLALPRRTAVRFVLAGGVYVFGAVGLDAVTGWIVDAVGQDTLSYVIVSSCEEILEMAGLLIFIDACLNLLARRRTSLTLSVNFSRT